MRFGVLYRLRQRDVCFASDVQLCLVTLFAAGEKLMKKSASADFFHYYYISPLVWCGLDFAAWVLYAHPTLPQAGGRDGVRALS